MKRSPNFFTTVVILFALLSLLSACGGNGGTLADINNTWDSATIAEIAMSSQYKVIQTDLGTGYSKIQNEDPEIKNCYSNYQTVEKSALAGQYDTSAGTGAPNEKVNSQKIVQNLTPIKVGDIGACQQLETKLTNDISLWRLQEADDFNNLWDKKGAVDQIESGNLSTDMRVGLAKKFREVLPKQLKFPENYFFPTLNLSVVTRDFSICKAYHNFKTSDGESVDDCDWNAALNDGTLIANGAYDYMSRPFIPPAVSTSLDTGNDNLDPLGTPTP